MKSSNPTPKGRHASKSNTRTPPTGGREPNKVTTTKKGPHEPRETAKAPPSSSRSRNNNNRAPRNPGNHSGRKKAPPEDPKPATNTETPSPNKATGFESWLTPQSTGGPPLVFEDAPPKIRLDDLLKRAKSPGDDDSTDYGKLTHSQIEDTSEKIDQYEANQRGKQPTKPASESDQAEAKTDHSDEVHTTQDASDITESTVGNDKIPTFVTAAKALANERRANYHTPGLTATGTVQTRTLPATAAATDHQVAVYERKLNHHQKTLSKADATVDKESFIQETVERLATHTTNVLITNPVADLTRKVHTLTLTINSYQAKATKFVALPSWIPRSCKSKFTLSFPKDIADDDPELLQLQETVVATQQKYEKSLRRCIERKEIFLLMKTLDERRDVFASGVVAIAHDWLKLWLPRNKTFFRHSPLTAHPYQIVGLGLHRLLSLGCAQLRTDLDVYFNKELTLPQRLAWRVRHLPIFKTPEQPERRIFQNSTEAHTATMYPYTKVTWDKAEYIKLEPALRLIIDGPLKAFLADLCKATTYEFHQKYEESLDIKLAEIQIAARQKQEQMAKAATETKKALNQLQQQQPQTVQDELAALRNQVSQLQRTAQKQGVRLNANRDANATESQPKHPPKNSTGHRGKDLSVPPKDTSKGIRNGKNNATRNKRNPKKRKRPASKPETPVKAPKPNDSQDSPKGLHDNPPDGPQTPASQSIDNPPLADSLAESTNDNADNDTEQS
jgi:hypothetical protein